MRFNLGLARSGTARATLVLALVVLIHPLQAATAQSPIVHPTVEKFLQSDQPPLVSYRARRLLEASTRGGKMSASLEAWTERDETGRFSFEVINSSGSAVIRQHVLMAALREEQRIDNERAGHESAISRLNYMFDVTTEADPLLRIEIKPHRASTFLVNGAIFVTPDAGDLIRVQGRLSKRPSFWTRSVEITRRYERIHGVRVPVEMRSVADVRLVGASTFSMTYVYETINGERVSAATD